MIWIRNHITKFYGRVKNTAVGLLVVVLSLVLTNGLAVASVAANTPDSKRAALFTQAAEEFKVPEVLLLAVSYNSSRWTRHGDLPSSDNGYGIMNLRTKVVPVVAEGRGELHSSTPKETVMEATHYSLDDAAHLLADSTANLKQDERQNIRGAAAVLADYAKRYNNGTLPTSLNDWYPAIAAYSGYTDPQLAASFADDVFTKVQTGVSLTTPDNQYLAIKPQPDVRPNRDTISKLGFDTSTLQTFSDSSSATDCPRELNCRFVPAAYAANSPDPTDYGNWDPANRPKDLKIRYIILHNTEGSYQSAINWFQNPKSKVSAHYVLRSSDGAVTQMVRTKDVAWTAGNWFMNPHAINLEHEGFAAQGQVWFTDTMYRASAKLVRYLAKKYDIPLDRQHILGSDAIPRLSPARMGGAHWDPGPYWNWDRYMELLRAPNTTHKPVTNRTKVITIAPKFATNQPPIQQCSEGVCTDLPAQGSNVVYLRTRPEASAPLLSNKYLHPDGAPGTNNISDWSATAAIGDKFALVGKQGDWTAIWFGGEIGWFHDPAGERKTASASHGKVVTPKAGRASIPVYAGAYPESSAYPSTIPDQSLTPVYDIPAGQAYTVSGKEPSDYFYDATIDFSLPDDHMIVRGNDVYYRISFNHRLAYVKADDVDVRYW